MQFGYFDAERREYVITRPDTPAPWANYLGSPKYGAIITANAGGYSFVESGAAGRLLRYHFNQDDTPGRYIYLRDDEDGDFWSASWLPVAKSLEEARYTCRHGTGYTAISAQYRGIASEATYYVPLEGSHEVWLLRLRNTGSTPRTLSILGAAELTNDGHYEQDSVNLQYTQFITRTFYEDGLLLQTINENCRQAVNGNTQDMRFFTLCGGPVISYSGDRESFLGAYHGYEAPTGVRDGKLTGQMNYGGNTCAALHTRLQLPPGGEAQLVFLLGEKSREQATTLRRQYEKYPERPARELAALQAHWHGLLNNFQVNTPSAPLNHMMNTWNAYQCFITFIWSRAASLTYCGLRNGYGYRDTVQDIQGIIHLAPDMAREKLLFMLSAQVHHGGALPLVKFTHDPGHENSPEDPEYAKQTGHPSYRADDALWLFPTVYKYIAETGEHSFLDEVVSYADKGEDTVYKHMKKAIDFSMQHLGIYGLPAGLHADWNDCLRLGEQGASVFVALQLYYTFDIMERFALQRSDSGIADEMKRQREALGSLIETHCWNGDRYIRGISETGEMVGHRDSPEASLWMNPQSWAVISGHADEARARKIMDTIHEGLNTPWGMRLMSPPYKEHPFEGAQALLFNPGLKENGGIFLQPQGWLLLAEALLGHGNRAFDYYLESCPAAQNDSADTRRLEPYAYGQFAEGSQSPFAGRSNVHWLTGTASTVMVGCVEGILGLRPTLEGLHICPSTPAEWQGFTMRKNWRGKWLSITVQNPQGKESGCTCMRLNGQVVADGLLRWDLLAVENEVSITM